MYLQSDKTQDKLKLVDGQLYYQEESKLILTSRGFEYTLRQAGTIHDFLFFVSNW
jgi:hypothetical protein